MCRRASDRFAQRHYRRRLAVLRSIHRRAGADGLELNLYEVAADAEENGAKVEERALQVVRQVNESVSIPVAVKLSPFYSSFANFARKLDDLKVDSLVLFNRFYQPDIDVEQLEVVRVNLSSSNDLLLRLRGWGFCTAGSTLRWQPREVCTQPSTP